jgi:hypothetical protein
LKARIKLIYLLSFLIAIGIFFSGCSHGEEKDCKKSFLTIALTSNYNDRYTNWLAETEQEPPESLDSSEAATYLESARQQAVDDYYQALRSYVTDDYYDKMVQNRAVQWVDRYASDNGVSFCPTAFTFAEYSSSDDGTTYTFTATLDVTGGSETSATVGGQITVQGSGDAARVSNVYFSQSGIVLN